MAIVSHNDLTLGLRGRVGKYLVFRTFGGKTIASHTPRKPDPGKQSDAQRKTRATFREAAAWAVQTLRDPEQRRYFEQRASAAGLTNAYTAAVQHRMRWSGGLHDDRVSIEDKPVIDEEPKSTSVVRVSETNLSKEFLDLFHQRSPSFPASVETDLNPTRTHPVEGTAFSTSAKRNLPVPPNIRKVLIRNPKFKPSFKFLGSSHVQGLNENNIWVLDKSARGFL